MPTPALLAHLVRDVASGLGGAGAAANAAAELERSAAQVRAVDAVLARVGAAPTTVSAAAPDSVDRAA